MPQVERLKVTPAIFVVEWEFELDTPSLRSLIITIMMALLEEAVCELAEFRGVFLLRYKSPPPCFIQHALVLKLVGGFQCSDLGLGEKPLFELGYWKQFLDCTIHFLGLAVPQNALQIESAIEPSSYNKTGLISFT